MQRQSRAILATLAHYIYCGTQARSRQNPFPVKVQTLHLYIVYCVFLDEETGVYVYCMLQKSQLLETSVLTAPHNLYS